MPGAMWTVPRRCKSKGAGWISEVVIAESVSRLWDLYGTPLLPTALCGAGPCSTKLFADLLLETQTANSSWCSTGEIQARELLTFKQRL